MECSKLLKVYYTYYLDTYLDTPFNIINYGFIKNDYVNYVTPMHRHCR